MEMGLTPLLRLGTHLRIFCLILSLIFSSLALVCAFRPFKS